MSLNEMLLSIFPNINVAIFYLLSFCTLYGASIFALGYVKGKDDTRKIYKDEKALMEATEETLAIQAISGRRIVYLTDEEREKAVAEYLLKARRDYESGISAAYEKGVEEERERHLQKKMDSAFKMLKANLPIEQISNFLGLSIEEVVNLEHELTP